MNQKTFGIFIRPYRTLDGEYLPYKGTNAKVPTLTPSGNAQCPEYDNLQGGDIWVLYNHSENPTTSYRIAREIIKHAMDDLGYKKDDIKLTEVIPIDHIITPYV